MDTGYEMIATPPKKITSEEVPPTKIDAEEILRPSQEQPSQPEQQQKEEINPDKTDDGSYIPAPDERQSPNFETSPEKDHDDGEDLEKKHRGTIIRARNRSRRDR